MCGIIGYIGKHSASQILIDGLKRLEYRGYDSAGLITLKDKEFFRVREPGRVDDLRKKMLQFQMPTSHLGIAHTRWATHGGITENNAHPHISSDGLFAIIHNGVIENYLDIKKLNKVKIKHNVRINTRISTSCGVWNRSSGPTGASSSSGRSGAGLDKCSSIAF